MGQEFVKVLFGGLLLCSLDGGRRQFLPRNRALQFEPLFVSYCFAAPVSGLDVSKTLQPPLLFGTGEMRGYLYLLERITVFSKALILDSGPNQGVRVCDSPADRGGRECK